MALWVESVTTGEGLVVPEVDSVALGAGPIAPGAESMLKGRSQ